ncbi:MAG: TIGR02757 family protein [Sedimentisphaerales bacterium]
MNSFCITAAEQHQELKTVLDALYEKYNRRELIKPDPLQFVYEYSKPADMEVAGFLAASLAYGRVEQIQTSVRYLLAKMGKSPYEFVLNFKNRDRAKLVGFKHRFNTGDDIADLLMLLQQAITKAGSIEKYFMKFYDAADVNIIPALSQFCDSLLNMKSGAISRSLQFLLAGPGRGGAAKRLNMFLRWMVRRDDVDAGLWRSVDKTKLIVPVDVHIGRLTRILGFHNHKNVSLKTAVEITRRFAEIEPTDPVKYDFSLSRIGIVENCTGKKRDECEFCELLRVCQRRADW